MRAKLVIVRRRDQRVDQTPPVVGFPREKKGHALCAFSLALYKSAVVQRIRIRFLFFCVENAEGGICTVFTAVINFVNVI